MGEGITKLEVIFFSSLIVNIYIFFDIQILPKYCDLVALLFLRSCLTRKSALMELIKVK